MSIFSQLKDKVAQYVDVRVKLIKIGVISRASSLLSYFMYALICLFILLCVLLFSGLSLVEGFVALGLSRLVSTLIVLGVYLLTLILLGAMRNSIIKAFSGIFIRIMTEVDKDDDDDDEDDDEKEKK